MLTQYADRTGLSRPARNAPADCGRYGRLARAILRNQRARYIRPCLHAVAMALHLAGQAKIMALEWLSLDGTKLGGVRDRDCLLTADSKHSLTGTTLRRNASLLS
jgi:hypothetical protein